MATIVTTDVHYAGHDKNLRLANGEVELVLSTEVGPRILRYGRVGGANVFGEIDPKTQAVDTPFGEPWHIYGGHRLWYAPEDAVRTYFPDNAPVCVAIDASGVVLTQKPEPHTGIEKHIEVELDDHGSQVTVLHRLTNHGDAAIELAPWALSVMAKGGRAFFPQPAFIPHPEGLAPARPMVVWPYTRMRDPRWTWGDRFIRLEQDPARAEPQKIGLYDSHGWMAYAVDRTLFVKRHHPQPGAHADFGCNVETFANDALLELETLGPLTRLAPGASVTHVEHWHLFDHVELGESDDAVHAVLAPLIESTTPGR